MTRPPLTASLQPLLAASPGPATAVAAVRGAERAVLRSGPVGESTRFETGSLTKTFTALLLAEMAARGEVHYGDRADRYLPFRLPGPPLTLLHLATHTSGLPRLPPGLLGRALRSGWLSNPYAGFLEDDLLASLRRTRLRHRPGSRVLYSNFGGGLLGQVLARAAGGSGDDYPALLAERVTGPLGLADTDCDPGRPQATGHWHGRPRPSLLMPGLTAAGAVRSSVRDLLRVLAALLDPDTAPEPALRTALAEVQRPRLSVPRTGSRLCLIWNLRPRPGGALIHHSGGTRGFTAFAGFLPGSGTGLVALTNAAPTPLAPFVQSAYGALCGLDAAPCAKEWTARV
ncbi:serine hydrolase [Streptomyces sp. HB132]|uniref:serine hydrolase domain-containing protein n=1 Tax=Streptomyces sp. HB132 TaxID=767388 RepID=UPI0019617A76|nr:serine hydrolase domain-containing protein [Streptomyces sp. HB132]MBM7439944.1 CubicO group peptidase (beta-lactamase class C family) [Streptomyces sp. HB132]